MRPEEVGKVAALLVADENANNHARLHAALAPAVDRFYALEEEEQDGFRDALTRFVRTYSFLSQVISFNDVGMERDYRFCRALAALVRRDTADSLDLGAEVELTHLQLEQTFEGSVSLGQEEGVVTTIYSGTGRHHEPEASPLSQIVDRLNERFVAPPEPFGVLAVGAHGTVLGNTVPHVYGKAHDSFRNRQETASSGGLPTIF